MNTCGSCGAVYTGKSHDGLCEVCVERNRELIYADPIEFGAWKLRQLQRLNHLQIDDASKWPVEPRIGFCPICRHPIDDHRLTYSAQQYNIAMCKLPRVTS